METVLAVVGLIAAAAAVCAAMLLKGKAWQSFVDDVTEKEEK